MDSKFEDRQRSNLLKIVFELEIKNFHLLKVFLVILAFISPNEIFLFLMLVIIFGQISESIKKNCFWFPIIQKSFAMKIGINRKKLMDRFF